tara:strand:- start:13837 stop:14262 length:426 start_codon:yes stop_codon:yes gene_type:complete
VAKNLRPFLSEAFNTLKSENQNAFLQLFNHPAPCSILIQNGSENFTIKLTQQDVLFLQPELPDVRVRLRENVIIELINNNTTLLKALRKNQIMAFGSLDALSRLNEVFNTFIRGAIRCPSLPELLTDYLTQETGDSRRDTI